MSNELTMALIIVALIIQTAENNYYYDCSALNRKQLNYAGVVFEYIRAVLPPVSEMKMERFLTMTKKAQTSILTFAVEVPRYVASPSPRFPSKRPAPPPKQGPGRVRKIRRQEEWIQLLYNAIESEHQVVVRLVRGCIH